MTHFTFSTGGAKFILGWVTVFALRLIPFRPPNLEPMLATVMPFSARFSALASFLFAGLGIALYDLALGSVGIWTLITALAYGAVSVGAVYFFRKREAKPLNFALYAIIGTLLYDILTGLTVGPLFFGQPFMVALVGQVPFTLMHLLGNVVLALVLSPILHRWIVENECISLASFSPVHKQV